jgi:uncharacterized protein
MRFSLLPRDRIFYQLLERLAETAEVTVKRFGEMTRTWTPSHQGVQEIRDLEHACDLIVHEIMIKLNKTFVTPFDREDIQELARKIDDLVDSLHALSERMVLFKIKHIRNELKEMAILLEEAMAHAVKAIRGIRNLKNTGAIHKDCIQIHTLENQGDRLFEKALGTLFEPGAEPLEVIKWKELYDFLETAVDECEDIADIVWGIVVKYG